MNLPPETKLPVLYVKDTAELICKLHDKKSVSKPIFNAGGVPITLREMVDSVKRYFPNFEPVFDVNNEAERIEDVTDCDLVVEAVVESLDVKTELLRKLEKLTDSPLCSNTSVICIDDIAERIDSKERFLGVHWMNPPYVMPLVEIILSRYTSTETARTVETFLKNLRKETVICRNQSLVNRFNAAVLSEASKMIDEGISFRDVDKVWKTHLGILYSLFGPLGNIDYIGLDVVYSASLYLFQRFADDKFKPSEWLTKKVESGELGVKTGKGIYEYGDFESTYIERVEKVEKLLKFLGLR